MSNTKTLRTLPGSAEGAPGATTTFVSADPRPPAETQPDLHPALRAQLRELQLRTGSATPDLAMLLRLINEHYQTLEGERRGIVESMRLMADEARALAREAHAQSSDHLQVILDHIKDVVLALDEEGVIRTFNPTGERVFGYAEAEVVGQRVDLLIPDITIATDETVPQALQFWLLVVRSTQTPLQLVWPGRQIHAPDAQTPPIAQVLPHMPQLLTSLDRSAHTFCAAQNV